MKQKIGGKSEDKNKNYDRFYHMKMNNFFRRKDSKTILKDKGQIKRKISAHYVTDEGLIYAMCKETTKPKLN